MSANITGRNWGEHTRATPPATMIPKAETPFMEAAPVAYAIGDPVVVGAVTTPVEATPVPVGRAAPVETGAAVERVLHA